MDVSCERCRTEYEFDEARLTDSGVAVKCASCGHIFLVRKPVRAGGVPPVPPEKPREWMLRKAGQAPVTFRELTTLQKWIVEGKVGRADEISLKGDVWKALGEIPELAPFFKVFDDAQRAKSQAETKVLPFAPPALAEPAWAEAPAMVQSGASAPAFAPVPQALGMPSPERPPVVQAPIPRPQLVAEAPPMAPMKVAEQAPRGLPKLPVLIGLVVIGVGAFYVGRMYRQRGAVATSTGASAIAPAQPAATKATAPAQPVSNDAPARDAVTSALAHGPIGTNALKIVNAEQPPSTTPTHAQTAEALVKAGAAPANGTGSPSAGTAPTGAAGSSSTPGSRPSAGTAPAGAPGASSAPGSRLSAGTAPAGAPGSSGTPGSPLPAGTTPSGGTAAQAQSGAQAAAAPASGPSAAPTNGASRTGVASSPATTAVLSGGPAQSTRATQSTSASQPSGITQSGGEAGSTPKDPRLAGNGSGSSGAHASGAGASTPRGAVASVAPGSTAGTVGASQKQGTDAKPKPAPAHDYDWYLLHADRLRQAGRTEAAVDLYDKALALKPDRAEPIAGLGLAELDLGDNDAAQVEFGKALSLNPGYSVAVMGMAQAYEAQGKKPDAIRFYQRFLELEPSGEEAQAARASIARLKQP